MHVQPFFSMSNGVNSVNNEAWFMNRISEFGVTKTPTSVLPGTKQRSVDDILGYSLSTHKSHKQVRRCGTTDDRKNVLDYVSNARNETCISTKPWDQLFADDDNEEMEKMTLQDIQRMLRKAIERSLNKEDSIEPASGNYSHSTSDSGTPPSVDSEAASVGIELLLEDSTSNSSDNMSLKGDPVAISSSFVSSRGLNQGDSEDLLCGHKRASVDSESRVETEDAKDDEWTLQKWQKLYHKQHSGRKRLRKHCKVQQETSESIGEVCSNSRSLALLDTSAGISEVQSSQLESSVCKVIADNCERDSSDCKHYERWASVKVPLLSPESFAHKESSQMSASFCSLSTVRLELEDEPEITTSKASLSGRLQNSINNGWALKPCHKVETTPICNLASPQAMLVCKTNSGIPFRKAFNPERASVKVSGQRKLSEDITPRFFPGNPSGSKQRKTILVHGMDGICKSEAVLSENFRRLNANQAGVSLNKDSSNSPADQLEGTLPLEQSKGTDYLEQSDSQLNGKGLPVFPASLNCIETLEIEEEQEPQQKPAKIPCKRKAISPMSQEFLLKASKLGEFGVVAESRGVKRPPLIFNEDLVDLPKWTKSEFSGDMSAANEINGQRQDALQRKARVVEALQSNASLVTPSEKCVVGPITMRSQHISAHTQKISLVSPNPPSKPENPSNVSSTISPSGSTPLMPAKGILRSSCKGPCGCEECASVRSRAERASEFSQRQMQDIEGLAVKLMKDLSVLRNIVEDRLIQSSVKHESPRPVLSLDQLKKASANAADTEETARKWLVRMARDCNRYCKIMRMQGRKLTFADESGGKLCHVKVFHSEPGSDSTTGLHGRPLEANWSTSSAPNEPAVEVVCSAEVTI